MKYKLEFETNTLHFEDKECTKGNINVKESDEIIDIVNKIREVLGHKDLVGEQYNNDVYYQFYLMFNMKKHLIRLIATCNGGKDDDYVWYYLPLTKENITEILFSLCTFLTKKFDIRNHSKSLNSKMDD